MSIRVDACARISPDADNNQEIQYINRNVVSNSACAEFAELFSFSSTSDTVLRRKRFDVSALDSVESCAMALC